MTPEFFTSHYGTPPDSLWQTRAKLFSTEFHNASPTTDSIFRAHPSNNLHAHLPWFNLEYYEIKAAFEAMQTRASQHHKNWLIQRDLAIGKMRTNVCSANSPYSLKATYRVVQNRCVGTALAFKLSKVAKNTDEFAATLLEALLKTQTSTENNAVRQALKAHNVPVREFDPAPKVFYDAIPTKHPLHYLHDPHVSEDDTTMLAYTQSLDKLRRNIQTRIKPGRYLAKFYPELTSDQIKKVAENWQPVLATLQFKENTDPHGWTTVYAEGPYSCMRGESCVEAYARPGNHLRLAYLEIEDKIVGRCIVRTDKMEYIRAYPSPDGVDDTLLHNQMVALLEAAGFSAGNMNGISINTWEGDDGWVAPFIDYKNGGTQSASLNYSTPLPGQTPDYFTIEQGGDYELDQTSGYCQGGTCCNHCGDRMRNGEGTCVASDEEVCEYCLDHHFIYAHGRRGQDYYPNDDVIYCESDGQHYLESALGHHGISYCDQANGYYHLDDLVFCDYGRFEGDYVLAEDAKELPEGWCLASEYEEVLEEHFPDEFAEEFPEEDGGEVATEIKPELALAA